MATSRLTKKDNWNDCTKDFVKSVGIGGRHCRQLFSDKRRMTERRITRVKKLASTEPTIERITVVFRKSLQGFEERKV